MTTMMGLLVVASVLSGQPSQGDRAEAERLARTGAHTEALQRFQLIAADDPGDVDARVWIGRLHLWMGHADRAASVFQSILAAHVDRVDAMIGLGSALTDLERLDEAVSVLDRAESLTPDDPVLLVAQGRAHLAAARTTLALAYLRRATLLRPADPELRSALERARRLTGHFVSATGFLESFDTTVSNSSSAEVEINLRAGDRLRLFARGQQQRKFDQTENRGGAGLTWRPHRAVTLHGAVLAGLETRVLPQVDALGEIGFARRSVELLASARYVDFEGARVWIASPGFTLWLTDGLALTGRYYRSETEYAATGRTEGNDSGLVRLRVRLHSRLWVDGSYASGTESFDTLSLDRLGAFQADTVGGGFRLDLPSLTSLTGTYEYQWRDDETRMLRATLTLAQRF